MPPAATKDAASKQPLEPTFGFGLLPPPCSYEDLYSSYQNEWNQENKQKQKQQQHHQRASVGGGQQDVANYDDDLGGVDDIETSVSDLRWVVANEKTEETYLLACTNSGKVLAWKLATQKRAQDITEKGSNSININERLLLEPHARLAVGGFDERPPENDGGSVDGGNESYECRSKALYEMRIVSVPKQDNGSGGDGGNFLKRKRKRRDSSIHEQQRHEQGEKLLIIAGESGLWSIPLVDALMQPWGRRPSPPPLSLVLLSDRPIVRLQSSPSTIPSEEENNDDDDDAEESGTPQTTGPCLFALEKDTNTLVVWKLSAILEKHNGGRGNDGIVVPEKRRIDLSRCFSRTPSACNSNNKPLKPRLLGKKYYKSSGGRERATTFLVVPGGHDGGDSGSGVSVLVGTDRSNLWVLPLPHDDDDDEEATKNRASKTVVVRKEAQMLSLLTPPKEEGSSPKGESRPPQQTQQHSWAFANSAEGKQHQHLQHQQNEQPVWRVTDILETNGGTWWTVSATAQTSSSRSNNNSDDDPTGLLVTWHAPTGMVVACQETREAIQAIAQTNSNSNARLYSASNEAAVAAWNSSFKLERSGRFWASPPSSKAIAIRECSCGRGGETNSEEPSEGNDSDPWFLPASKTMMVVAGVGNKVDLFVDHCRVQTVRVL